MRTAAGLGLTARKEPGVDYASTVSAGGESATSLNGLRLRGYAALSRSSAIS
jgi:hypothetical protein